MTRPRLLFHCQHSLGLGHLVRSLALADALAADFDVVLLNGGRFPAGFTVPSGVDVIDLVPLGHDADQRLISHDPAFTVAEAQQARRDRILRAFDDVDPAVIVVELYPFGRTKFEPELGPLLHRAAALGPRRPRIVCSVRDILVDRRGKQLAHDERACQRANEHLDTILVHADPAFARFEESFRPATALRVPVHHTGFVVPRRPYRSAPLVPLTRVIVSAGGGIVGGPLFAAAVDAHRAIHERTGLATLVVAGPFVPDPVWDRLVEEATASPHLEVVRSVDDLASAIGRSTVSISQGGYNTTMDLLAAGTPAIVVPYVADAEDEQHRRTVRLAGMGVLRRLPSDRLTPLRLVDEVVAAIGADVPPTTLDMTGAQTSARIVAELAEVSSMAQVAR